MAARTFTQYLLDVADHDRRRAGYAHILSAVAVAATLSASVISRGSLILEPSRTAAAPDVRDVNRTLRRLVTKHLLDQTEAIEQLAAVSIARSADIIPISPNGRYLVAFEALHGMKNLIDDLPVGSVFSVLEREVGSGPCTVASFLQPGSRQVAAGVTLYGPRTVLVLTAGEGVDGFTLDSAAGNFVLTHPGMSIPADAPVFAIDPADAPHWPGPVKRYVDECLAGAEGPRERDFTMRWNASVLVGAYRVLNRGGLFLIPGTARPDQWLAPLLHNAAPLGFLAEQAGGRATTGSKRVLDVIPTSLTSRTPLFFGSANEVTRIERYFEQVDQSYASDTTYPLFHNRSLFAD
jgi:fructose-1,6-bisphosphatase